ncbi:hypothetical protein MLD38_019625 [Melastoma candidum]|uniref:Uncharacterized protein n=1 Tax=Melastoma candidum TaxID=119954 RepID=A0ACB9QXI4_9MYRT|nr:hypothetical protein MLD38_019625 [Melastoma candidum]
MKKDKPRHLSILGILASSCFLLLSQSAPAHPLVTDSSYDYDSSATSECLAEPGCTAYKGGIIVNPEFSNSTAGWTVFGKGAIELRRSPESNVFMVALHRKASRDSFSQRVFLEEGNHYSFSAWIQVSEGTEAVAAMFRTSEGVFVSGGSVIANRGCWSLLKGGIFANSSGPADVLFESRNTSIDLFIDNVSLQPFSKKQWRSHQDERIKKVRKSEVTFRVIDCNGTEVREAIVSVKQTITEFPFGCGLNFHILDSEEYRNWFSARFKYTTFTNSMKWYSTEEKRGIENYTVADAMVVFAEENCIRIRGHNIFWDDPKYQPEWVKTLSGEELRAAAERRINSVVTRYKGRLIAWDVVNENLHFSFFEDNLGENASAVYFSKAYSLDPCSRMFMNEYNTIEYSGDVTAGPSNYLKRLKGILTYPGNDRLLPGIGVQGHFGQGQPNLAYIRSSLDILATAGIPIWMTEVDVSKGPGQDEYLEEVLREGFSHPAVEGIIMFAGPESAGFNSTTLVDRNFKNTPAGEAVDRLIEEWRTGPFETRTDDRGRFKAALYHGEYEIRVENPVRRSSTVAKVEVNKASRGRTIDIKIGP